MAERPRKRKRHVVVDGLLLCGLAAIGMGALAGGRVALGLLALAYLGWTVVTWIIARRGSDRVLLGVALARPFFCGGWLVALATVIVVSRKSLDWVVILPLGLVSLGGGIVLLILTRSAGRKEKETAER